MSIQFNKLDRALWNAAVVASEMLGKKRIVVSGVAGSTELPSAKVLFKVLSAPANINAQAEVATILQEVAQAYTGKKFQLSAHGQELVATKSGTHTTPSEPEAQAAPKKRGRKSKGSKG